MKIKDIAYYVTDKVRTDSLTPETYIGTDNILPNRGGIVSSSYFSDDGEVVRFKKGDVLIGNIRPYFKKIWLATFDGGCSPDVLCLRSKGEVSPEFLYCILSQDRFFEYDVRGAKGSKMPRGDKDHILEFPIDLVSGWDRIGSLIVDFNEKIRLNGEIASRLESLARLVFDYWFIQFEFPDEQGRPYKSSGGKMKWSGELKREIPEDWGVGNLYQIADFVNGLPCQKYRPTDSGGRLPVVKIREMHNGITSDTEYVRGDIPEENIIDNGDLIFSWSACLEVMVWNGGKAGLNQHIFKVIPKSDFSLYYVYEQISSYIVNFQLMAAARKTTMGHITADHLEQSRIVLPPSGVLREFESRVASFFKGVTKVSEENKRLTSLRDFLLPLLMNGQLLFK